jgi:hypothetical protein
MKSRNTAFELRRAKTLANLKQLAVALQVDASDIPDFLLAEARARLKNRIRRLLKRGGCEIVRDEAAPRLLLALRLRTATDCVSGNRHQVYRVGVALREMMALNRPDRAIAPADTWHHECIVGYVPVDRGPRAVESAVVPAVTRAIEHFLNDVAGRDLAEEDDDFLDAAENDAELDDDP